MGSIPCAVRAFETDPRIAARKVATFGAAKALDASAATRSCGLGRLARLLLPRQRLRDQGLAYFLIRGREHRVAVAKCRPQGLMLRVQILSWRLRNGGRLSVVRRNWRERRRGPRRLRS